MTDALTLPAVLDLRAAGQLKADIQSRAGAALDLDASKVERVGGLCLQVLIAAEAHWRSAGHAFRLTNAGASFRDDLRLMNATQLVLAADNGSALSC
jgi:chemotaxis protein CheX